MNVPVARLLDRGFHVDVVVAQLTLRSPEEWPRLDPQVREHVTAGDEVLDDPPAVNRLSGQCE